MPDLAKSDYRTLRKIGHDKHVHVFLINGKNLQNLKKEGLIEYKEIEGKEMARNLKDASGNFRLMTSNLHVILTEAGEDLLDSLEED